MAGSEFPSPRVMSALDMSGGAGIVRYDLTEAEYIRAFNEFSVARRYRITDVRGYELNRRPHFAAVWEQAHAQPGQNSRHDITPAELGRVVDAFAADGLRPLRFTAYVVGAATRFAGIWELTGGPERLIHWDIPEAELDTHVRRARDRGFRIIDLCGYAPATSRGREERDSLFTSVWELRPPGDGPDWLTTGPVDADQHQRDFAQLSANGWRPVRAHGWHAGRVGSRFATVWLADPLVTYQAQHGVDSAALAEGLSAADAGGLRVEQLGAYSAGSGRDAASRFCPVWTARDADQVIPALVAEFARDFEVPAVAVAVARRGRLAYAQGHGIQDPGTPGARPVSADRSLFRIASISKPITSAAIMQLAARGALSLDDTVFGPDDHLAGLLPDVPADPRATAITVRHLLQHAAGGWAAAADDPMFGDRELSAAELVGAVVCSRPLEHRPGTHFAYSNFGYCVLGRLIEKVTGRSYEEHLRGSLLADCGISDMYLAGDGRHARRRFEVAYRGQGTHDPYDLPVRRMDSHGGWLASAVDLLRFAVRVDGFDGVPDVLERRWITEMTTVPDLAGSTGYGAGWGVHDDGTWSHTGRLTGTATLLALTPDGLCVSLLTNTSRVSDPPDPTTDTADGLFRLMGAIRDRVDFWPGSDSL